MKAAKKVRSQRPLLWCHHPGKKKVLNQRRQVFHVNKELIPQAWRPLLAGTAEPLRADFTPAQQRKGAVPVVSGVGATSAGSHEVVIHQDSRTSNFNPLHSYLGLDSGPAT